MSKKLSKSINYYEDFFKKNKMIYFPSGLKWGYKTITKTINGQKFKILKKYKEKLICLPGEWTKKKLSEPFSTKEHHQNSISILTGKISNLFIVDTDIRIDYDGQKIFLDIAKKENINIKTVISITQSGSYQYWFKYSEDLNIISNDSSSIIINGERKKGVDVRTNGGMIYAPTSYIDREHIRYYYDFAFNHENFSLEMAEFPKELIKYFDPKNIIYKNGKKLRNDNEIKKDIKQIKKIVNLISYKNKKVDFNVHKICGYGLKHYGIENNVVKEMKDIFYNILVKNNHKDENPDINEGNYQEPGWFETLKPRIKNPLTIASVYHCARDNNKNGYKKIMKRYDKNYILYANEILDIYIDKTDFQEVKYSILKKIKDKILNELITKTNEIQGKNCNDYLNIIEEVDMRRFLNNLKGKLNKEFMRYINNFVGVCMDGRTLYYVVAYPRGEFTNKTYMKVCAKKYLIEYFRKSIKIKLNIKSECDFIIKCNNKIFRFKKNLKNEYKFEFSIADMIRKSKKLKMVKFVRFINCPEKIVGSTLNLFNGFDIEVSKEPEGYKKDMTIFLNHIHNIWCKKRKDLFNYILSWFAFIIQKVGQKSNACLVLISEQGAGKNIIIDKFHKIIGNLHSTTIQDLSKIENFNELLENRILVMLDEAYVRSPKNNNALKNMITQKKIHINEKYIERRERDNNCNFIIATNHKNPILLDLKERRLLMMELDDRYSGPTSKKNKEYFEKLGNVKEESILWFFQNLNIEKFNSSEIPETETKNLLILQNLNPITDFVYNSLLDNVFPGFNQYSDKKGLVSKKSSYLIFLEQYKGKHKLSRTTYTQNILKLTGCEQKNHQNVRCFIYNDIEEVKDFFCEKLGMKKKIIFK